MLSLIAYLPIQNRVVIHKRGNKAVNAKRLKMIEQFKLVRFKI